MKYFTELIESYLTLHETKAKVQLDPGALNLAKQYFDSANAMPPPTDGNPPNLIPVKEIGGNVYKNDKGQVIFDNFPTGMTKTREIDPNGNSANNKTAARQNFSDFVKLFMAGSQSASVDQGAEAGGEAAAPQPPTNEDIYKQLGFNAQKMYDKLGLRSFDFWLNKPNARLPSDTNLMMNILRLAFPAADDSEEAKKARDNEIKLQLVYGQGPASQLFESIKLRFNGGDQGGSLAKMLANHVMIIGSADGKQKVVKTSNQELITSTYDNLEKIMVRVSNLVRDKQKISDEECKKFQDTIVPMQGSRIYFNDRGTNTGIVINDKKGGIRNMFDMTLKAAGCGLGPVRAIGSIAGAAAQIRGSFSESVQRLVIEAANCSKMEDGADKTRCSDRLGELFEDFKDKEDLLIQSLSEYKKVLDLEEASIPIGEENSSESLAYSFLFDKYGSKVSSVILRSLVTLAKQSYMERQPDSVVPIDKDTRFGKKGDTLELWNDKERFIKAMEQYGISRESAEKHMVVVAGKFGADISLKNYITLKDGVSLGSVSENTLNTLISGGACGDKCTPEEREQYRLLREGMAASLDQPWMRNPADKRYKRVADIETTISKAEDQIDSLSENTITTGADGKELNIDTLKKFVTTLSKQMKSEFDFSDLQDSGLLDKMERYLKKEKSPNQIKAMMKNFVRSQILNKYSKSTNSEETQAYKDHLLMSEFAAGGSRNPNTLVTANGIDGQDQFTGKQNDLLDPVRRFHAGEPGYRVETNVDGSETTYYGPGPDGNIVPLYKASTTTSTSGRRSRGSHVEYNTIKNARAQRKPL